MNFRKQISRVLSFSMLLVILYLTFSSDVPNSGLEIDEFKSNNYFPPDQDTPSNTQDFVESPIAIDALATGVDAHNWTWAVSQPWCSGAGTPGDPYLIENVTIDVGLTDYGIWISNSLVHFVIRNCGIDNAGTGSYDAGIYFVNVSNGRITKNLFDNNYRAILLRDYCENNSISLNNITGMATTTSDLGIYLYNHNSNISITENRINSVNYGIYGYSDLDYSNISLNTIFLISHSGIHLNYNCDNNTISENDISDCSYHGIYLANTNQQNLISQNSVYLNDQTGILVQTSNFNNITFNQLDTNDFFGLQLIDSTGCVLLNNSMIGTGMGLTAATIGLTDFYHPIVENNTVDGKKIYYYYEKANLTSMNFTNAAQIYLIRCNDSEIVGFTFSGKDYGAAVVQCLNITIVSNTFSNHIFDGVLLFDSEECDITDNSLINNGRTGIYLNSYCNNITLEGNNIIGNGAQGIYMGSYCSDNFIIRNTITGNFNDGIYVISYCLRTTIFNNTISSGTGLYTGIRIATYSDFTNISSNTAFNNQYGLYMGSYCDDTYVYNNSISENRYHGMYFYRCANLNISYNYVARNGLNLGANYGIYVGYQCISGSVLNNTLIANNLYGLYLDQAEHFTVSQNYMTQTGFGISGSVTDRNDYTHNFDFTNLVDGKVVYYYLDQVGLDNTNFANAGQVYLINVSNCVVSGLEIINRQYGIYLLDSNFISASNCNFSLAYKHAIYLYTSNNNTFIGNDGSRSGEHSVYLNNYCSDNWIQENNASETQGGAQNGVYIYSYCNNNTVFNNTIDRNLEHGISIGSYCNWNNISYNKVRNNQDTGILISSYCENSTIFNNTVSGNLDHGIYLSTYCKGSIISFNYIDNNGNSAEYGVYLYYFCVQNMISNNIIRRSFSHGINIYYSSSNNTITNNRIFNNGKSASYGHGIYIGYLSEYCDVLWNNITDNQLSGISFFDESHYGEIKFNNISHNNQHGIYILDQCNFLAILNNSVSFNQQHGILIENDCDNNEIHQNQIFNNTDHGIYSIDFCDANTFLSNLISNNTGVGIGFYEFTNDNDIFFNEFRNNSLHAIDNGLINDWDNGTVGNFWDNYTGNDWDDDGIGNMSYFISGSANREDHFPIWDDGLQLQPLPNISSSGDIQYFFAYTGYFITWIANTTFPGHYNITRNGTLISSGLWENNVPISINVDALLVGIYSYTCIVNTTRGEFSNDSVLVTVIRTFPLITHPPDITYEVGQTGHDISWIGDSPLADRVEIYRDGLLVVDILWTHGIPITLNVDSLAPGVYLYECYLSSTSEEVGYDAVVVTVTEPAPTITHPADVDTVVDQNETTITWVGSSPNPGNYSIILNGDEVFSGLWEDGQPIEIDYGNLNLTAGTYVFECILQTASGEFIQDTVVIVIEDPNATILPPPNQNGFLIVVISILFALLLGLSTVTLYLWKKQRDFGDDNFILHDVDKRKEQGDDQTVFLTDADRHALEAAGTKKEESEGEVAKSKTVFGKIKRKYYRKPKKYSKPIPSSTTEKAAYLAPSDTHAQPDHRRKIGGAKITGMPIIDPDRTRIISNKKRISKVQPTDKETSVTEADKTGEDNQTQIIPSPKPPLHGPVFSIHSKKEGIGGEIIPEQDRPDPEKNNQQKTQSTPQKRSSPKKTTPKKKSSTDKKTSTEKKSTAKKKATTQKKSPPKKTSSAKKSSKPPSQKKSDSPKE